ncbi:MAG: fibronectin type III domain-containing protein, partial [Clostridia bacterium]|nr:fibronectin type III domain-containing protein [Clostridia bacterium]
KYTYTIRACDARGNISEPTDAEEIATGKIDTEAPTSPGRLRGIYMKADNYIYMKWDKSKDNEGVKGYYIYRDGEKIGTTQDIRYEDRTVERGNKYTYTVCAYDATGNISEPTNEEELLTGKITIEDTEAPTVPQNLKSIEKTSTSITLAWDEASDNVGVTGYEIYQGTALVKKVTETETTCTVTGLEPGTEYSFAVKAYDKAVNISEESNRISVKTEITVVPTVVKAETNAEGSKVLISFDKEMAEPQEAPAGFAIKVDGKDNPVEGIGLNDDDSSVIELSLENIIYADAASIEVSYTKGTVKSVDGGELDSFSNKTVKNNSTVVTLEAPKNITATATMDSITVTWEAVANATSYEIEVDGKAIDNGNKTSYEHTGLAIASKHSYRVRTKNAQMTSGWSKTITQSTSTDTEAPTVPQNLRSTEKTSTSVTLAWDEAIDNVGVVGYEIYKETVLIEKVTGTTYTVTGLKSGTKYSFFVKAFDKKGNISEASNKISEFTLLESPKNITATATMNSITIKWDAVVNATSYEIEADGKVIDIGNSTSYKHTGLAIASKHSYRIKAKNAQVTSRWSKTITPSTTTDIEAPTIPQNLRSTDKTINSITLVWDKATDNVGVAGYEIYHGNKLIKKVTGTTYTVTGLAPGTKCVFYVKAYDKASNVSKASNAIDVITHTLFPVLLSTETTTDGKKIILTFNKNMAVPPKAPGGFIVTVNGIEKNITAVTRGTSLDTIELTVKKAIYNTSQNVKISYTAGVIKATDGTILQNFLEQSVTNNSKIEIPNKKHNYTYDDSNRLKYIELSTGEVVHYSYDTGGNLINVQLTY